MSLPSQEEITTAAEILSRLKPGFLPQDIFLQVTRLTVSPTVEVVPFRIYDNRLQVLLIKRSDDDPNWPNMLHTPGTVILSTDKEGSYISALQRVIKDELGSVALAGKPQYVESVFHMVNRGMEDAKVFYVEVLGVPPEGTFYDIDKLPSNIVTTQIGFINAAARSFRDRKI
jgi:hypothetical protein